MTDGAAASHDTIIIGGGITGAALLHWLASAGHDVVLFESEEHLGGVIASGRTPSGALFETGPNSVQLSGAALWRLIDELDLRDELITASDRAKKRFIVRDGRLLALPTSPGGAVRTPLLSLSAKLRLLREPWIAQRAESGDESVADFVARRLGREVLDYLVNPFFSGIYAGRPEDLSAAHSLRALVELERGHGSIVRGALARRRASKQSPRGPSPLVSFADGMGALPGRIEARWRDRVRFGAHIDSIARTATGWSIASAGTTHTARRVVLATGAHAAAALVAPLDTALASTLRGIDYPPVSTVVTVYARTAIEHPLDGFGCLVPEAEGRRVLGIVFNSSLFEGRAPDGAVVITTFLGGARQPACALASDEEIRATIALEHRELLGASAPPIETRITRWSAAIPQYRVGYAAVLEAIASAEARHQHLHLAGSYRGGVSVGDCVRSARELADAITGVDAA